MHVGGIRATKVRVMSNQARRITGLIFSIAVSVGIILIAGNSAHGQQGRPPDSGWYATVPTQPASSAGQTTTTCLDTTTVTTYRPAVTSIVRSSSTSSSMATTTTTVTTVIAPGPVAVRAAPAFTG